MPTTPCSGGLVPASHFLEIHFKSISSKENDTSANLLYDNSLIILTLALIYSSGIDTVEKELFSLNMGLEKVNATFRVFFSGQYSVEIIKLLCTNDKNAHYLMMFYCNYFFYIVYLKYSTS